jgi:hypothetical protein
VKNLHDLMKIHNILLKGVKDDPLLDAGWNHTLLPVALLQLPAVTWKIALQLFHSPWSTFYRLCALMQLMHLALMILVNSRRDL